MSIRAKTLDHNKSESQLYFTDLPGLNAIKIGNLFFKAKDIEPVTAQMVRPITNEYSGEHPILGLIGSGTLLRTATAQFVACTRHQLGLQKGVSFEEAH